MYLLIDFCSKIGNTDRVVVYQRTQLKTFANLRVKEGAKHPWNVAAGKLQCWKHCNT